MYHFFNTFILRIPKTCIFSVISKVTYKKWNTVSHQFPGAITIQTVKPISYMPYPLEGGHKQYPPPKMMIVGVLGTSRHHEWTWGHSLHLGTNRVFFFYITIILVFLNGLTRVTFMIGLTFALSHWSVRLVFFADRRLR